MRQALVEQLNLMVAEAKKLIAENAKVVQESKALLKGLK